MIDKTKKKTKILKDLLLCYFNGVVFIIADPLIEVNRNNSDYIKLNHIFSSEANFAKYLMEHQRAIKLQAIGTIKYLR